jgi:hypothetical protein
MGQKPKDFGNVIQNDRFLITDYMVTFWDELSDDTNKPILRVVSGPAGVGKSYFTLFLTAKAYASGHIVLYASDAGELAQDSAYEAAWEICARFLAINKDILTSDDFATLLSPAVSDEMLIRDAASNIMNQLLRLQDRQTYVIIDEHSVLFSSDTPATQRLPVIQRLGRIEMWSSRPNKARVVLAGTSHAKFERLFMSSMAADPLILIGPMSPQIFVRLLAGHPVLERTDIRESVMELTGRIPRELLHLASYVVGLGAGAAFDDITTRLHRYRKAAYDRFYLEALNYYNYSLLDNQREEYRKALARLFMPTAHREGNFDWRFMDLGLVYRFKNGESRIQYFPVSQSASDALLQVYRACPVPNDVRLALVNGRLSGAEFENLLFNRLMSYPKLTLTTTDLAGKPAVPLHINIEGFKLLSRTTGPQRVGEKILVRGYDNFPRFDFTMGRTFIQVSISDFVKHNSTRANIANAFLEDSDGRNEIERYLDASFGGTHRIRYNTTGGNHFTATKDGIYVNDFRIVYICGRRGNPNHTGKVEEFPDVLHISYDEIMTNLFGELVPNR